MAYYHPRNGKRLNRRKPYRQRRHTAASSRSKAASPTYRPRLVRIRAPKPFNINDILNPNPCRRIFPGHTLTRHGLVSDTALHMHNILHPRMPVPPGMTPYVPPMQTPGW